MIFIEVILKVRPLHGLKTFLNIYRVAKILRRKIVWKIEEVLGEDQFGFRRGKGTRDVIGMLRIIAERTFEVDAELCVCFIDWQKASDRVEWTTLMQILKVPGIDWREIRLISSL